MANIIKNIDLGMYLALDDIRQRYARTFLGPFWLVFGTLIWILSIGFVTTELFGQDPNKFFPFIAVSMVGWAFISTTFNESCTALTSSSYFILNTKVDLDVFFLRTVFRNFIVLLHQLPVIVLVFIICKYKVTLLLLLFPILLFFIGILLYSFTVVFSLLHTRYRDFQPLIVTILSLLGILTPIIWKPETIQHKKWIYEWNPFYHFMEIFRSTLLGYLPSTQNWINFGIFTVVTFVISVIALNTYKYKCKFWL